MEDESKTKSQIFVIAVVLVLLILVMVSAISLAIKTKNDTSNINVKFVQVYSSDMSLSFLGEDLFIGSESPNRLSGLIDKKGQEIYRGLEDAYYDGFYKTKDDNYLFYDVSHNKLITFYFDGEKLQYVFDIDDVSYAKPIIYKKGTQEYILGFFSKRDEDLNLYMLNNTGIIVIKNVSLVSDYEEEGNYYTNSSKYLIVKNKEGLVGAINLDGKVVIDYKYNDLINTFDDTFIAVSKKGKYGIIDSSLKKRIDLKYKAIMFNDKGYLVVDNNNKMAFYNRNYEKIIDFEMKYDSLREFDVRSRINSINLWSVGNNYAIVNNYLEGYNKTEYGHHDLYEIRNGKIIQTVKQIGFNSNGLIYSYDKEYNVHIYDIDFNETSSFTLENVNKIISLEALNNNQVYIKYLDNDDKVIYKLFNGTELKDFDLGELIEKGQDYYLIQKDNSLVIYDNEFNKASEIIAKDFNYKDGYVIAENSIYVIDGRK